MSKFAAEVVPVVLEPHPNADSLSIAHVLGWQCVVRTDSFENTDRGVYIPLDAIVPDEWLQEWGLAVKLAGSQHNRVKTIKLRGEISQGLLIPTHSAFIVGADLTATLGLEKYEPPIPTVMNGIAKPWPRGLRHYDIERYENYPDVFKPDDWVHVTEKLDGTNFTVDWREGALTICSRRVAFDPSNPDNAGNLYCKIANKIEDLGARLATLATEDFPACSITVHGEIVGPSIQGNPYALSEQILFVFDVEIDDHFVGGFGRKRIANRLGLTEVPEVYLGEFRPEVVEAARYGPSLLNPKRLREGTVWLALDAPLHPKIGRPIVKMVDPEYLLKVKD